MTETSDPVFDGFECDRFSACGFTRPVYRGGEGPAVVLMHGLPGLYPGVVDFGRVLIAEGYTVVMPSMFGTPNKPLSAAYGLVSAVRACVAREFTVWGTGRNSPITAWLRELASHAFSNCGGPGVAAIGMCLTGGFALAMMVDDHLIAPVLSQPSLPVALTGAQKRDLGIDRETLDRVKERVADGVCVMGLRFTGDRLVPEERFATLRKELGAGFIAVELDSSWGNPHGIPRLAHSVLVHDYVDRPGHPTHTTRQQVLDFLRARLHPPE